MLTRGLLFFVVAMLGFLPSVVLAVPSGQTLTWPDGSQGPVEFEGEEHAEQGLKCASCHPLLFKMKKGSAKMTMNLLNKGQFCGACHNGKVAFSTNDPGKCHECHKRREKHHQRKNKHHD